MFISTTNATAGISLKQDWTIPTRRVTLVKWNAHLRHTTHFKVITLSRSASRTVRSSAIALNSIWRWCSRAIPHHTMPISFSSLIRRKITGGFLGLCMGASLLSFAKLIELAIKILNIVIFKEVDKLAAWCSCYVPEPPSQFNTEKKSLKTKIYGLFKPKSKNVEPKPQIWIKSKM